MNQNDINKSLSTVFEGGRLPTMVYIIRQGADFGKINRPMHSHDSISEFGLLFKGRGHYRVGSKLYEIEEGDLMFYNQNERHEVISDKDDEIGSYFFGITDLHLKDRPQNHFVKDGMEYVIKAGSYYEFLSDISDQIYHLNQDGGKGSASAQLLCAAMISVITQLGNFRYANSGSEKENQFAMSVIRYLDDQYTQDITLEMISDKFGCSPSYISHTFKKAMGESPIQYIIRRRVGLAQSLLISSDLTATEIAARVGYDNSNYFTSLFLKIVGVTPISYRKRYLENLRGSRKQL
ncbi:MAG: AraC family transcriptional regulator [Lachnospiraceae bacterium]